MQTVAETWLVYRLTGRPPSRRRRLCDQIPVFAGHHRRNGRRSQQSPSHPGIAIRVVLPLILATLVFTGHVHVWHVFTLAATLGVVNAFDVPARQAFVIEMVGKEDLVNAIALNSSIVNGARTIGPAVAGVLLAAVGEGWCFLINGLSYVAVITGLLLMKLPAHEKQMHPPTLSDTVEGFRFIRRSPPIRDLLLLVGLVSFAGMSYSVLMPIFADSILHGGPKGLGLLMASAGFGSLCGALSIASRSSTRGLGRVVALSALTFGVGLMVFALSRAFWLSAALLFVVGMSMITQAASTNTLIQSMVPDALRGRVMAVYAMMFMGMSPIGALVEGALAERIGAPYTLVIGGCICVAGAIIFNIRLPGLRIVARQLIDAQRVATVVGDS
jgi:MFS family permease